MMDRDRYESAADFDEYLGIVEKNAALWQGVHERVRIPAEVIDEARTLEGGVRLAALSEDWCGDAVNTLPVIAKLATAAGWDFRVFSRDENPDIMDAHLTAGRARSIPVVVVYDESCREIGWWGPRPEELQGWVLEEGLSLPSPDRYKVARRWYARDRGRTTLDELLRVVRSAA